MNRQLLAASLLTTLLLAAPARAELLHLEIKTLGMD
jgi:hypothetical protein